MATSEAALKRMLNPSTMVVNLPPCTAHLRNGDREVEYQAVRPGLPGEASQFKVLSDPDISFSVTENALASGLILSSVSRIVAGRFQSLVRSAGRVVSWKDRVHAAGELSHYDNLWVATGNVSRHERLLCWHKGGGTFVALHHCPCKDHWCDYMEFLNMLESRWYYMKQEGSEPSVSS